MAKNTNKSDSSSSKRIRKAAVAEIEQRIEQLEVTEKAEVQPVAESKPAKLEKRPLPEINGMLVRVVDPLLAATEEQRYKLNDKPIQCYSTMKQCCEWLNDPKRAAHELELLGHKFVASLGKSDGVIILDTDGEPIDDQWSARFVICYRTQDVPAARVKTAKTSEQKAAEKQQQDADKAAKRLADQQNAAAARDAGLSALVQAFIVNASSPEDQIAAPCRDALMTLARFGVIKSDGTVDTALIRTAKQSTTRGHSARVSFGGQTGACGLLRWMGCSGFTEQQATAAVQSLGMSPAETTVRGCFREARSSGGPGTACKSGGFIVPVLTDADASVLLAFKK